MDLSQASSGGQHPSNAPGFDAASEGGDSDLDFKALFEQTNAQLEETKGQSSRLAQELEGVKHSSSRSNAELERIKAAITGDDGAPVDQLQETIAGLEAEMDQYLQAAIDHERAGKPIPLTINSAVKSLKHQIAYAKQNAALEAKIAKLEAASAQQSNPQTMIDQTAYNNMDSHIESALQSIYGNTQDYADVRSSQFASISQQIIAEIKDLKKTDPQTWDRIRRDRKAQTNLVNHFVKKTIPPKARQIMEQEHIRSTPLTTNELWNAYREAKDLATKDPRAQGHMSEIRQELLARMMEKSMGGGSSKQRMGDLFTE